MKNKIIIISISIFLIISAAVWFVVDGQDKSDEIISKQETGVVSQGKSSEVVLEEDENLEVVSIDKVAGFEGVELSTHENPYGYRIKFPSSWRESVLVDNYASAHYYFSPYAINDRLQGLLLKPFGCEGEGGCSSIFGKYSPEEYSLFEIYTKMFDKGSAIPEIKYSGATKTLIVFPDKTQGVVWTLEDDLTKTTKRIVVINDGVNSFQYRIEIRDPQQYELDFTNDILPILSTFELTGEIKPEEFPKISPNTKG